MLSIGHPERPRHSPGLIHNTPVVAGASSSLIHNGVSWNGSGKHDGARYTPYLVFRLRPRLCEPSDCPHVWKVLWINRRNRRSDHLIAFPFQVRLERGYAPE